MRVSTRGTTSFVTPDPEVSKLASELMSDRYELSKIHAKILGEEEGDKDSRLLEETSCITSFPGRPPS